MFSSAPCCSYCGKQPATLKRCSVCKHASYCGAECQNAGWRQHKKTCAPPLPLDDVVEKVKAAHVARDWRGVLELEGRMEEMMGGRPDATCSTILKLFITAHSGLGHSGVDARDHLLSAARLMERRIGLLGRMERFRDQGQVICAFGINLVLLGREEDAAKQFERARAVGAAHGFFSLEANSCLGLGQLAMQKGRDEEGVELLQNALVAGRLAEDEDINLELAALSALVPALIVTNAIDEAEPLLPRLREAAKEDSQEGPFQPH